MKSIGDISDIGGCEIAWGQPDWSKWQFEIHAGEEVIGTLVWKAGPDSVAVAQSAEGVWTLKHGGFNRPWVAVRPEGKDWDIARFHLSNPNGIGILTLHDGRKLRWGFTNDRRTNWRWEWVNGTPLISIRKGPDNEKDMGVIEIHPHWDSAPDASLLTLLGCYLIAVLNWADTAAEALAG